MYDVKLDNSMFQKEELIKRLKSLDRELYLNYYLDEKEIINRIEFTIVGSSCLILRNIGRQYTNDIDILDISHTIPLEILEKYDMNLRVQNLYSCFPENYSARLEKINIPTYICDFYIISLEDTIIAKIVAYRGKDKKDIYNEEVIKQISFNKLFEIANEMKYVLMSNRELTEFTQLYNIYIKDCGNYLNKSLEDYKL